MSTPQGGHVQDVENHLLPPNAQPMPSLLAIRPAPEPRTTLTAGPPVSIPALTQSTSGDPSQNPSDSQTSSSSSPGTDKETLAIVGLSVALGLISLAAMVLAAILYFRKKSRRARTTRNEGSPSTVEACRNTSASPDVLASPATSRGLQSPPRVEEKRRVRFLYRRPSTRGIEPWSAPAGRDSSARESLLEPSPSRSSTVNGSVGSSLRSLPSYRS
ncbi:hypothetical protein EYR38_004973 [Pleurotus pulmonarius]|nr:hypothetical protein EYR38_004973 [Pleurotus pulmonarius]